MIKKKKYRKRSHDMRSCKKRTKILSYIVNQSCVVMQKTDSWKDQASLYRFWKNENVSEKGLTEIPVSHCIEQCRNIDHMLLIEDTSEIN